MFQLYPAEDMAAEPATGEGGRLLWKMRNWRYVR